LDAALLQKINDQTNIVDLVSEYVELTKAGKNLKGLCPFHQEKTPSFFVSPEKNIAKCMSCQTGGQPITFYKEIKGISFQEAANELAVRAGIIIEDVKKDPLDHIYKMFDETIKFYQFSLMKTEDGAHAVSYLKNRDVKDETIQSTLNTIIKDIPQPEKVIVRASGTEDLVRITVSLKTQEQVTSMIQNIESLLLGGIK